MKKRLIALVLTVVMVVSLLPVGVLAAGTEGNIIKYVSIGDSMTNGYGFTGYNQDQHYSNDGDSHVDPDEYSYFDGTGVYGEGSYALQFEKYLAEEVLKNTVAYKGYKDGTYIDGLADGVDHIQLATSAFRTEELVSYLGLIENQYDKRLLPLKDGYLDNSWAYVFTDCTTHRWSTKENGVRVPTPDGPINGGHTSCGDHGYIEWFIANQQTGRLSWDENGNPTGPNASYDSSSPLSYDSMFNYLSNYYQDNLMTADVISLALGNAAFDAYFMDRLFKIWKAMGEDFDDANTKYQNLITLAEIKAQLCENDAERAIVDKIYEAMCTIAYDALGKETYDLLMMGENEAGHGGTGGVCELLTYIFFSYMHNYKEIIEWIGDNSKDNAQIMIVGMLNSYYGITMSQNGELLMDMGEGVGAVYDLLNTYVAGVAADYMEKNPEFNGKFLFVEQPDDPEMIAKVIGQLADANWGTIDCGDPTVRIVSLPRAARRAVWTAPSSATRLSVPLTAFLSPAWLAARMYGITK